MEFCGDIFIDFLHALCTWVGIIVVSGATVVVPMYILDSIEMSLSHKGGVGNQKNH